MPSPQDIFCAPYCQQWMSLSLGTSLAPLLTINVPVVYMARYVMVLRRICPPENHYVPCKKTGTLVILCTRVCLQLCCMQVLLWGGGEDDGRPPLPLPPHCRHAGMDGGAYSYMIFDPPSWRPADLRVGNLSPAMGARNQVSIGLLYRPAYVALLLNSRLGSWNRQGT